MTIIKPTKEELIQQIKAIVVRGTYWTDEADEYGRLWDQLVRLERPDMFVHEKSNDL